MKTRIFSFVLIGASVGAIAQELEPIIYSSKQETPPTKMTSSYYTVDQDNIENQGYLRAPEALKQVPGVDTIQVGVVGGVSSIFIRGAESRHTVILIDGVKVYDPTSIDRQFNLAILNTLDIEKIEVLKGAQSVLYGSDAIGGVVNIITKKGEGKNRLKAGYGIVSQFSAGHTFDISNGLIYLNGHYQQTDVASDVDDKNIEDVKINKGVNSTMSLQFEKLDLETTVKYINDYSEIDGTDSVTNLPIDNNFLYSKNETLFLRQGGKYALDETTKLHGELAYTQVERVAKSSSSGKNEYDGSVFFMEGRWLKEYDRGDLLVGASHNFETYEDDQLEETDVTQYDVFSNFNHEYDEFIFDYGLRLNHLDEYGSHLVYSLGALRELTTEHSLKASVKTGFKAPSLYQLYGVFQGTRIGNDELAPEKSFYTEAGYEYKHMDMRAGVTLFRNQISDYIQFVNNNYGNKEELVITGLDSFASWEMGPQTFGVNFGYYDFDLSSGDEVAARASENLGLNYDYQFNDMHSLGAELRYKGKRYNYEINDEQEELDPYQVIDLLYTFNYKDLTLIGSVKNVLDEKYQYYEDYNTQRRGIQLNAEFVY